MKVTVIIVCLIGAVFANPKHVYVSRRVFLWHYCFSCAMYLTSAVLKFCFAFHKQTSEESDSQSDEDDNDSMPETQDDSMGSEENVRKNPTDSSDTSSNSADTSDSADTTAATSDSSDSTSEESDENTSNSSEAKLAQIKDCVNGTQSCESEEYFFQNIGDDGHFSVDNLMVPEEDERQLSLRR
uniref:Secretory calcium-binding phosphoprotein 1 n=1 Tax=Acanthochromis polyacanthus TaxID=80966 RepID=A0A3Q1HA34_9TELE